MRSPPACRVVLALSFGQMRLKTASLVRMESHQDKAPFYVR
ncbi:hypothetical protein AN403_6069 [Pseudomonas fluorescens]|uniref:Uncharacterized protein n=1 Tax=Pseudomonas fluorescens TaxID=294 RepID=A0A0N8NY61_PSEFL|nr:hypothetical protein AN403_6069 [Pseudomonas fluorescens]